MKRFIALLAVSVLLASCTVRRSTVMDLRNDIQNIEQRQEQILSAVSETKNVTFENSLQTEQLIVHALDRLTSIQSELNEIENTTVVERIFHTDGTVQSERITDINRQTEQTVSHIEQLREQNEVLFSQVETLHVEIAEIKNLLNFAVYSMESEFTDRSTFSEERQVRIGTPFWAYIMMFLLGTLVVIVGLMYFRYKRIAW